MNHFSVKFLLFHFHDFEIVTLSDGSAFQHNSKYAFSRHDTFSHAFIDFAVAVTLFPDLRHLQDGIPASKTGSYRKTAEIITADDQIFSESTKPDVGTFFAKFPGYPSPLPALPLRFHVSLYLVFH